MITVSHLLQTPVKSLAMSEVAQFELVPYPPSYPSLEVRFRWLLRGRRCASNKRSASACGRPLARREENYEPMH